jgi:multiple sugar transport system substrate-binding protein
VDRLDAKIRVSDSVARDMRKRKSRGLTRRELVKGAGMALAAGALPVSCARRAARRKTLRIIQWSHYVPGYDRWFDGVFTKEWGRRTGLT